MDIEAPRDSPGDEDDDDDLAIETVLEPDHQETDLGDWTTPVSNCADLGPIRKITVSTSRLFLLAVEYADPALDYARTSFSNFEPSAPFSPQPSTSLSDFEHRVSPLDPNLSSAARYSPVYGTPNAQLNEELLPAICGNFHSVEVTNNPLIQYQVDENSPDSEGSKISEEGEEASRALSAILFGAEIDGSLKGTNATNCMDLLLTEPYQTVATAPDLVCTGCGSDGSCQLDQVQSISDKPVPPRSWATLPVSYLAIGKATGLGADAKGVFARKTIPKRTQFGPVEGILSEINVEDEELALSIEQEDGKMLRLDTSDENFSNWMRYVRPACEAAEQNLIVSQQGESLYFTTTRVIPPRQELLVWYCPAYALKRGLSLLQPLATVESVWQCFQCNVQFPSSLLLQLHLNIHDAVANEEVTSKKPKKITRISKKKIQSLMKYSPGEKRERAILQCNTCQCNRPNRRNIRRQRTHNKDENSSVEQPCTRCYLQEECRRVKAGRRGSVNPAKPNKCELCYKAFASEDRLQRHMLVHGAEESKPLQCEVCLKRFLNNSALSCHVKIHSDKKFVECPICKAACEQVLALKEHVAQHATNGIFSCPQCSKTFDEYALIRKHMRAFHCERKHDCCHCAKLFPTLDKLRMHMLRHSDHREFLCADCGKQFKRKDKLKEHMKRMHSTEREHRIVSKPLRAPSSKKVVARVQVSTNDYHRFIYKCHTCLVGFKRRGMLVNHLAKRHPDVDPESVPELNLPILKTTRDYYCQYCDKVYKSSSKRKAHILKNHPGAELPMSNRRKGGVPIIPGVPNPTFSQTVGSVTTLPHGCSWCHKQYASKAKLLQHQRKKHDGLLSALLIPTIDGCGPGRDGECEPDVDGERSLTDPLGEQGKCLGDELLSQAMSQLSQTLQYQQLLSSYTER